MSGKSNTHKPVVFENSLGETISNDPVFLAQRTLASYGLSEPTPEAPEVDDQEEDDSEEDLVEDYTGFDSKDLKVLAAERGVDMSNIKKLGALRSALMALDAEEVASSEAENN